MHRTTCSRRHRRAPSPGFAAIIPLAAAVLSSLLLMTACHSTSTLTAKASPAPDARPPACDAPCAGQAAVPLQAFDEHFYTPLADANDASPP